MKLKIALAQTVVTGDIAANLRAVERGLRFAAGEGAQLLLTPEGALSGYTHLFDRAAQREALAQAEALARSLGVGMALGTCQEEDDGLCYNEQRFYTPEGEYLGCHTKTLCCGGMAEPHEGEYLHYAVKPLRTFRFRGAVLGGLICNDVWANPECTPMPDPHLVWRLREMGAQAILHSVNGGGNGSPDMRTTVRAFHTSNLVMRARSAGIPIVSVDAAPAGGFPAACPSGVVDGSGKRVFSLPETGEQLGVWELDLPPAGPA